MRIFKSKWTPIFLSIVLVGAIERNTLHYGWKLITFFCFLSLVVWTIEYLAIKHEKED